MTIAFYVSGHGFGHASRQVEVINTIGTAAPAARLVLRTAVSQDLLRRTLSVACQIRPGPCDSGIVQTTSIQQDDVRTIDEARAFHRDWTSRVAREAAALAGDWPSVIVGDIPPLAFAVAHALGVPSVAIGNFTWDWIYETHPGFDGAADVLSLVRAAYRRATLGLRLPLSGGFAPFSDVRPIPFIARRPRRTRAQTRRHFGLDANRPVALLSFGGYGLPELDLSTVDCLSDWTVVTTDRVPDAVAGGGATHGVVRIEERLFEGGPFRDEDLVAASDVVVTKPGYGIIADCIAADTAMLYTSRGPFREYDVLVEALPRYLRARFISQSDLFAGRWRAALDAVTSLEPPPERPATDGAAVAAEMVLELCRRGSSSGFGRGVGHRMPPREDEARGHIADNETPVGGSPHQRGHLPTERRARRKRIGVRVLKRGEHAAGPERLLDTRENLARHLDGQRRERQSRDDVVG